MDNKNLVRFLLTFFLGWIGSLIINYSELKPEGYKSRTLAYIFLTAITFGISAFLHGGGLGIGLGLAFGLYFLQLFSNLIKETEFLKFITPFSYTDGAYIVANSAIEIKYLFTGAALALLGISSAYWQYCKKDIA